ncbi:zinc ribbon domain-containing protein [Atopobium fossor]|uniref:zinc ribbon domain-containing protein n=1 Tax=Atopobium fossor TaxID=39487 RepID=UPI00041A88AE|nr:C4-type zinc ribbon domain-containing protein [Atopobium fossor]
MTQTDALLRLQEVDLELIRTKRALAALPQKEKIKKIKQAAKSLSSELTKLVGARKDVQIDLDDNRATHQHMLDLVEEVSTKVSTTSDYRAIADLEAQLTHLAKRIERLDFEKAALDKDLAKLQESEAKACALGRKLQSEAQIQADAYKQATADITASITNLNEEREQLVSKLDTELLEKYNTAVQRFGGLAVEKLVGNNPSICRVSLQPSSYADIRAQNTEITTCPYCHRMLVVTDPSYNA